MSKAYRDFFHTLKRYLLELQIDEQRGILGCSEEEILALEKKTGPLPLAYKEYLRSIGKQFLFEFMNAETMAFDDLDHIQEFGLEVFKENNLQIERPHLVISERRNEYISLIYLDEGDNPNTWIMSEYWSEEEDNLTIRTNSFTQLIVSFFRQTLEYRPAGFHFVTPEESEDNELIKSRYLDWSCRMHNIRDYIRNNSAGSVYETSLNEKFMEYWRENLNFINECNEMRDSSHQQSSTVLMERHNSVEKKLGNRISRWINRVFK